MRSNNFSMGMDDTNEDMRGNSYKIYTDDTILYTDILSFDDHNSQKPDPNKHPLSVPTDPWLVAQAGVSDIRFPATDAPASSTDIFGRLSPTMEQIANSLLPSEVTLPLIDDASFDVDIALDSITPQNDDVLGAAMESLVLEPPGHQLEAAPPRRRSERLSSKTASIPLYSEAQDFGSLHPYPAHDLGTTMEENPWSPVSNADGADRSERANTQRRRRPRVSYSTLTEEEKYQRIRDLNNEASRQYRGRIREQLTSLQQREVMERQRNKVLKAKAAGLERLRDEIKEYTYNFFREHVGNHATQ